MLLRRQLRREKENYGDDFDIDKYVKSADVEMVDKQALKKKMVDKWSIKPSLAEKMVDILAFMADKRETTTESVVHQFGFTITTAKRYMRQLTEFGYIEAQGGNKNRTYRISTTNSLGKI